VVFSPRSSGVETLLVPSPIAGRILSFTIKSAALLSAFMVVLFDLFGRVLDPFSPGLEPRCRYSWLPPFEIEANFSVFCRHRVANYPYGFVWVSFPDLRPPPLTTINRR